MANEAHGDDPGTLVFAKMPLEEKLKIEVGGKLIWEGTRAEFVGLYDKIAGAHPSLSNQYGKLCVHVKPDTEYLVIEV